MARQNLVDLTYLAEAEKRANGTWPGTSTPHPRVAAILKSWGIPQQDDRLAGVVDTLGGPTPGRRGRTRPEPDARTSTYTTRAARPPRG